MKSNSRLAVLFIFVALATGRSAFADRLTNERKRRTVKHHILAAFIVLCATFLVALPAASAVTIAWTTVGNPGNAADSTGYGAVGCSYNIGTYDVTASQYVAFLNSNDPTGADPLGLYSKGMSNATYGSVVYNSEAANGDKYSVVSGDGNLPINYVTFYDTLRFANWLDNGQTPGSTETGAYTLLGGTPTPSNGNSITRNADATVFLPSENEWYKAAYYNPATSSYYSYATSSNTAPTASGPTSTPNSANYGNVVGNLTPVGDYSGTTSPYGAYDMNGDVFQWNEAYNSGDRGLRGGSFSDILFGSNDLLSSDRAFLGPGSDIYEIGFRVASIVPEPSTGVLAIIACGMILWWGTRFK